MTPARPTLSVCLLARSSGAGLERLLDEVDGVADQIVIGVDAASTDDTLEIARQRADTVFRFEHVGPPVRARLLILEHAIGDWILSLDEDEGLDAAFQSLLPELLADSRYTHYRFTRKWITGEQPLEYVHASPWFPDWQLRLFRRDRRRVWHPGIVHSGYRVAGAGCWEHRTSILHYSPLVIAPAERESRIEYYRQHGSDGRSEAVYRSSEGRERRHVHPGPAARSRRAAPRAGVVTPGVAVVPPAPTGPPWSAALNARMASQESAGAQVLAEVDVRNTGPLAWDSTGAWPQLHLSHHVLGLDGAVLRWDGERFSLPRVVEPGESAVCLISFRAPDEPGDYLIEWDLVSEGECWFAACGSRAVRVPLRVVTRIVP